MQWCVHVKLCVWTNVTTCHSHWFTCGGDYDSVWQVTPSSHTAEIGLTFHHAVEWKAHVQLRCWLQCVAQCCLFKPWKTSTGSRTLFGISSVHLKNPKVKFNTSRAQKNRVTFWPTGLKMQKRTRLFTEFILHLPWHIVEWDKHSHTYLKLDCTVGKPFPIAVLNCGSPFGSCRKAALLIQRRYPLFAFLPVTWLLCAHIWITGTAVITAFTSDKM